MRAPWAPLAQTSRRSLGGATARHRAWAPRPAPCRRRYNHFVDGAKLEGAAPAPPLLPGATSFWLAVKDNIATADFATGCGSRMLAGHAAPAEATVVRQLRARGARVVGKTNMDEFGMGSHSAHSAHGPVRNPRAAAGGEPLSAGGSSGGSAVAVLVGDADVALGTDTGGSVRLPAAYTGVVGYRPSYGMLSRFGVVPYAHSLDAVGLLARNARPIRRLVAGVDDDDDDDDAAALDREHDPRDPTSLTPAARRRCAAACPPALGRTARLCVGLPLEYNIAELDPAVRAAWAAAAAALGAAGADVVPVSLPTTRQALCAYYVIAAAEASSNLAKYDGVRYGARDRPGAAAAGGHTLYADARGAGFGAEVKRRILLGTYSLSSAAVDNYFVQAQRVRRLVCRDFDRVLHLPNPLCDAAAAAAAAAHPFDLCDLPEDTPLADKRGPAQVDFLLSPTAPTLPPSLRRVLQRRASLDAYMNDVLTVPASLAGLPAVSLPAPAPARPPVGLQLIGQFWDDRRLLAMAERLQALLAVDGPGE